MTHLIFILWCLMKSFNYFLYDIIDKRKHSFEISRKEFNVPKHDLICTGTGLKTMNINHKWVDIRNSAGAQIKTILP